MSKIIDQFLSKQNVEYLRTGISKDHFAKILPKFVDYMISELSVELPTGPVHKIVGIYNKKFKQLTYNDVISSDVDMSMSIGKLSSTNYNASADSILDNWKSNVARQVQDRDDHRQYVADLDEPDYDIVGPTIDIHGHAVTEDADILQIFKTPFDDHGYAMDHDDYDSALELQEQIFGSSDIGAVNGYLGVRSNINIRERKNHVREYDRGNDGIRGSERESTVYRRDMKNVRRRY
jgi:hypothetical protein